MSVSRLFRSTKCIARLRAATSHAGRSSAELLLLLILFVLVAGYPPVCYGQVADPEYPSGQGDSSLAIDKKALVSGTELTLTNSGFGIGVYVRDSLNAHFALTGEVMFGSIKDEREDAFFNRLGERSIPNKANYLLVLPSRIGIQRRLFKNKIEDSFRPFLQITAGPTVGWLYPYFDDCNENGSFEPVADCDGNGIQEEGEGEERLSQSRGLGRGSFRLGAGGSVGLGAYIRYGDRGARGFRISYAFDYFSDGISLLESDVRGAQRYFGTASIVVFFGHLF